jgi:ABC-type siderophore export system fused ATPase/permease subunit
METNSKHSSMSQQYRSIMLSQENLGKVERKKLNIVVVHSLYILRNTHMVSMITPRGIEWVRKIARMRNRCIYKISVGKAHLEEITRIFSRRLEDNIGTDLREIKYGDTV